jgi:hypothetical protein
MKMKNFMRDIFTGMCMVVDGPYEKKVLSNTRERVRLRANEREKKARKIERKKSAAAFVNIFTRWKHNTPLKSTATALPIKQHHFSERDFGKK